MGPLTTLIRILFPPAGPVGYDTSEGGHRLHPTRPLRFCQDTQPDKAIVLAGKTFKTLEAEQSQISSRTSNISYALSEPVLTLIAQPFSAPVLLLSLCKFLTKIGHRLKPKKICPGYFQQTERATPSARLKTLVFIPSFDLTSPPQTNTANTPSEMASPSSPSPPSLSPTPHPNHLPPPTAPPQSKRDKRRHALSEKLTALTTSFHNPTNPRVRDLHYRAQLASIQADIHLITKCDASGRDMRLLDDSPEGIQVQVNEELERMGLPDLVSSANGARAGTGPGATGKEDASGVGVTGMAGRWYGQFIESVNEGMEERDAQLALLYVFTPSFHLRTF